ncbi:transposable element Tcb1 transposase [Trichonephila clavipes]|nr:transposable element Tcb1 transposase [Trichonephila clavipes]
MVWAGIVINGRTRLYVVANGTMTGQRYIDEVLLSHVCLFRGAVGDKFVFMDDNATCHRTLAVQDCLDSEGIQRLVWPVRSPDLNPIENVWNALGKQVAGRNYAPTNKNTLIRALTEEWDKLPQQLPDNVVQMALGLELTTRRPRVHDHEYQGRFIHWALEVGSRPQNGSDNLDLPDFLVINFDPPVTSAPRARIELKSALITTRLPRLG